MVLVGCVFSANPYFFNMSKKTIIDLKKSQIVMMNDSGYGFDIEGGVSYYPMSSIAMLMEHGAENEKFRTDGILWGLWGDPDLTEKDLTVMKCCFDYGDSDNEEVKKDERLFSVLFFDGSVLGVSLSRQEFEFIVGLIREQMLKIKDKKNSFSPLDGKLPMVRAMDADEIDMVVGLRKKNANKKYFFILFFELIFSSLAILGVFLIDNSVVDFEQKCLSMFSIVFFMSLFVVLSAFSETPLRDIENEVLGGVK